MPNAPHLSLSHVGVWVSDLEKMADFYTRVMGFTVTDRGTIRGNRLVFLSRDPREHHQFVLAAGRPADVSFNVVNQISFRVASLADLRAFHARLEGEPVTEIRPVTHGNAWSVYFRDPEGNRVEAFLDTPWYTPQPCGEPIDFRWSDEELMRFTEDLCRTRSGFLPVAEWRRDVAAKMGVGT